MNHDYHCTLLSEGYFAQLSGVHVRKPTIKEIDTYIGGHGNFIEAKMMFIRTNIYQ